MFAWFRLRRETANATPPARPLDAAELMRRARRLRFQVRPGAASALAGAYLGARPGTGLTFAELRAYEPGDDVRHLDWNVTARQGRPYVRRFVEERSLTLWLVVDVSASMAFGAAGRSKADRAVQAAALLAGAAVASGDRVGLLLSSDRIEQELPPAGGSRHLARLVRLLADGRAQDRRTDWAPVLERLDRLPGRALVVVLSDFLETGSPGAWRRLSLRHELLALWVVEPLEERLPDAGLLALSQAETGRTRLVDSGSPRVRAAYERAAMTRRRTFGRWCVANGLSGHELSTSADPLRPLLRIFQGRAARRVGRW